MVRLRSLFHPFRFYFPRSHCDFFRFPIMDMRLPPPSFLIYPLCPHLCVFRPVFGFNTPPLGTQLLIFIPFHFYFHIVSNKLTTDTSSPLSPPLLLPLPPLQTKTDPDLDQDPDLDLDPDGDEDGLDGVGVNMNMGGVVGRGGGRRRKGARGVDPRDGRDGRTVDGGGNGGRDGNGRDGRDGNGGGGGGGGRDGLVNFGNSLTVTGMLISLDFFLFFFSTPFVPPLFTSPSLYAK